MDRHLDLVPTPDSGDDFVWVCSPGERFGITVGLFDVRLMAGLKIDHASETPRFSRCLASFAKNPSTVIEAGARGRREAESEARVPVEPSRHLAAQRASRSCEDQCTVFLAGTCASMALRKRRTSGDDGDAFIGQ